MASAYECDGCKRVYLKNPSLTLHLLVKNSDGPVIPSTYYDLCVDCNMSLNDWLKERAGSF